MLNAFRPHDRVQLHMADDEKILTKQSFAGETEINNIMERYVKTGVLNHLNQYNGDYGQFIGYEDYHNSMNRILAAGEAFMALPAQTRAKFSNDPQQFLAFVQNPDNIEEMREMGLARRPATSDTPLETKPEAPLPPETPKPPPAAPETPASPAT